METEYTCNNKACKFYRPTIRWLKDDHFEFVYSDEIAPEFICLSCTHFQKHDHYRSKDASL
jgi:hypothetical protein